MVKRLGVTIALYVVVGCGCVVEPGSVKEHRAFTSSDSWYSMPPRAMNFTPLDKERFAPVVADLQQEAQAALAEVPARRLTAAEATRLVGQPLPGGGQYVLLRAVVLNVGTGAFEVGVCGPAVHVHHGCLGKRPTPMQRKALVTKLPAVPEMVFFSCSMAE